jgi:hypothetical protein
MIDADTPNSSDRNPRPTPETQPDSREQDLSPRMRALLDAHAAFELEAFENPAAVAQELGAAYDWLADQELSRLVDPTRIHALLRRRLLERDLDPEAADLVDAIVRAAREKLAGHTSPIENVVSREAFDLLVQDLGHDEQLRRTSIHGMVNNAVFSLLISEILYHGIEEFVLESKFTQSIPGAQSLFKFGQNLLNQTAPGLKGGIEKTIKEFIKDNAGRIIQNSETAVHKSLGPETIAQAANQFWDEFATRPIGELALALPAEKLPVYRRAGELFLRQLRESALAADLLETAVRVFFEQQMGRKLQALFDAAGLDRDAFVAELEEPARQIIDAARENGFLSALVRRRLLAFYSTELAQNLIS